MKKFAVIISGCGVFDGTEIHEAVLSLLAIVKNGGTYSIFAPDIEQHHVVNHLTGKSVDEKRNVLIESARIARGKIQPLSDFDAVQFDALLLPGGFGAAKNLCDYAFKGADCEVNPEVEKAISAMVAANKPVGALCIAPVIFAKILKNVDVTIGNDAQTAKDIEKMQAHHFKTEHGEVIKDTKLKVFSTPCYMLDANILQIAEGAENIVKAMINSL
ncbi:MAG: isoprenoid biosynthesis glyoxalase ElbB [Bacteroidetes bacterium]|nr:isoprenoid biosynthesis glyoxalase ElbB [Bacteroidota bacterium]